LRPFKNFSTHPPPLGKKSKISFSFPPWGVKKTPPPPPPNVS